MSLWYLLLIVPLVLVIPNAEGFSKDIGIDISTKCKIMIKNNLDTSCPTIEQILALFPDSSPKDQVGDFEIIDGMLIRGAPQYNIEHFNKYIHGLADEYRIWVNPPGIARSYMKMITIESNFGDYPLEESYKMSNNTITVGTERYINRQCNEIIISAENWIFVTGDTIVLLQHNCDPKFTNFDHIKKYYFEKSYQDITTSYKYKLEKWIEESKVKCKGLCFEY